MNLHIATAQHDKTHWNKFLIGDNLNIVSLSFLKSLSVEGELGAFVYSWFSGPNFWGGNHTMQTHKGFDHVCQCFRHFFELCTVRKETNTHFHVLFVRIHENYLGDVTIDFRITSCPLIDLELRFGNKKWKFNNDVYKKCVTGLLNKK